MFCTVNQSPDDPPIATAKCGKCGSQAGEPCGDVVKMVESSMNKLETDKIAKPIELRK